MKLIILLAIAALVGTFIRTHNITYSLYALAAGVVVGIIFNRIRKALVPPKPPTTPPTPPTPTP